MRKELPLRSAFVFISSLESVSSWHARSFRCTEASYKLGFPPSRIIEFAFDPSYCVESLLSLSLSVYSSFTLCLLSIALCFFSLWAKVAELDRFDLHWPVFTGMVMLGRNLPELRWAWRFPVEVLTELRRSLDIAGNTWSWERKDVQVGKVEEREEQDQSGVQVAVPCNAGDCHILLFVLN